MSSASVALARARSIIAGSRSRPVTSRPKPASLIERWPGPQPTSSTWVPAWLPAATSAAMPRISEPHQDAGQPVVNTRLTHEDAARDLAARGRATVSDGRDDCGDHTREDRNQHPESRHDGSVFSGHPPRMAAGWPFPGPGRVGYPERTPAAGMTAAPSTGGCSGGPIRCDRGWRRRGRMRAGQPAHRRLEAVRPARRGGTRLWARPGRVARRAPGSQRSAGRLPPVGLLGWRASR